MYCTLVINLQGTDVRPPHQWRILVQFTVVFKQALKFNWLKTCNTSSCILQQFILHHFSMRKYILVSCNSTVPTLRGPILYLQVGFFKSLHIRCTIEFVLFVNFYVIRRSIQLSKVNAYFPHRYCMQLSPNPHTNSYTNTYTKLTQ